MGMTSVTGGIPLSGSYGHDKCDWGAYLCQAVMGMTSVTGGHTSARQLWA